jgi:hypothetical protein
MQSGLAILCSVFLFPTQANPSADKSSPWLTDYAAARGAARAQDRPIFAVFVCMH